MFLRQIQPIFAAELSALEQQLIALSPDRGTLSLTLIPAYLTLLSTVDVDQVTRSLSQFVVALAISGVSTSTLKMSVIRLCGRAEMQEHVLTALWDGTKPVFNLSTLITNRFIVSGVVHQRPTVRCATAVLFSSVISHVSDQLANSRVAPALVTLASDSDM